MPSSCHCQWNQAINLSLSKGESVVAFHFSLSSAPAEDRTDEVLWNRRSKCDYRDGTASVSCITQPAINKHACNKQGVVEFSETSLEFI